MSKCFLNVIPFCSQWGKKEHLTEHSSSHYHKQKLSLNHFYHNRSGTRTKTTDCVLFLLWVVNASLKCLAAILLGILFQTPFLEFSFPRIKEGFSLETVFRKGNFSHQDSSNPPSLVSWNEIKFWKVSAGITFLEENSWNLESLPTYQYCG